MYNKPVQVDDGVRIAVLELRKYIQYLYIIIDMMILIVIAHYCYLPNIAL